MNSPTVITRSDWHLAMAGILMCGLVACSDEADSPQEGATESVEVEQEIKEWNPEVVERPAPFAQPEAAEDYAAAWPYDFELGSAGLETTVLALGDVWFEADGTFGVEPTPYQTVSGEEFGGEWTYELTPHSFGRVDRSQKLDQPSDSIHRPSEVSFEYEAGARVDYEHHHDGMKLFVHLDERPSGDGPVKVGFTQNGRNLDYRPSEDGVHVYHNGDEVFRWMGLIAYDADGQSLPVSMEAEENSLRFKVDDADANYPITIDPLATDPDWTFSGSQEDSRFGNRIVTGDVNGNGHTDVLITDYFYSGDEDNQGRVLLFLGSSDGFSSSADLIIAGDTQAEQLGLGTDMSSDIAGDGCDEIIIGAPGYDDFSGRVLHYRPFNCTESNPELSAELIATRNGDPDTGEIYGRSLATGDFSCNGQLDLLVAAPNRVFEDAEGNTITFAGGFDIYFGDTGLDSPLEDEPDFTFNSDEQIQLAWTTLAIPELDGTEYTTQERCDGFAVGGRLQNGNTGAVYVFGHDEDGEIQTPPTIIDGAEEGYDEGAAFGTTLSTMPSPEGNEINGHELSGIIIGAQTLFTDDLPGYVSIYEYSESSGAFEEVWHVEGPHDGSDFGRSVTGRVDFNGDGHHDLVVGAPHYDANTDDGDEGGAFIFLGTEDGLQDEPEMVLDSGQSGSQFGYAVTGIRDFGDDKDALIVGARTYNGFVEDGGRVFIYPGQENCYIDDVFYSAGTENPDNFCQVCDPEESTSDWSHSAQEGLTCDDGDDCTISVCESGQCVPQSGIDCDDGNPCTDNLCEDGECINPPANGGTICDDDGVDCTEHTCDDGECVPSVDSDTCFIEGACYDDGAINPGAECLKCDASNPEEWTPRDAGIECDNGLFCTVDDACDGAGECAAGEPRDCDLPDCYEEVTCSNAASACVLQGPITGEPCDPEDGLGDCTAGTCDAGNCIGDHVLGCIIDGQCIDSGTSHPDDDCLVCAPEQDDTGWTIASDSCFIDGQCHSGTDVNPNNDCQICNPMNENTAWSSVSAGESCDPDDSISDCASGECDGDGNCDVEIDAGTCVIDGQCVDQGTVNSQNECEICDPTQDPTQYTANAGAPCGEPACTEDNELIAASVCDETGMCQADDVVDCAPYVCDDEALACVEECEDDDDCAGDAYCIEEEGECSLQPVADAGADQLVSPDDEVTLDGTASFAPSGEELDYWWEQLDDEEEVELSDAESAAPTFIAPRPEPIDEDLELEFGLIVTDGDLQSEPDTTTVVVSADADDNEAPVAVITGPEEAEPGDVVALDGSESWDPDGDPLVNYNWNHVGGSPAPDIQEIEDGDGLHTTAEVTIPEEVDTDTVYEIGLIVSDGLANSPQDVHDIFIEVTDPGDDIGVEPEPDAGIPDAGDPPEGEEALGEVGGSGCVCSSTYSGERDTQGMVVFLLVLGFALWRRRRAHRV